MAKPLGVKPPSSSVTRLLDLNAAARAVGNPTCNAESLHALPAASAVPAPPTNQHPSVKREFVLTPAADHTFSRLVEAYRRGTGTKLTASHVARAVLQAVAHALPEIEQEASRIGIQKLPSNAKANADERIRFEAMIADAFLRGITKVQVE